MFSDKCFLASKIFVSHVWECTRAVSSVADSFLPFIAAEPLERSWNEDRNCELERVIHG